MIHPGQDSIIQKIRTMAFLALPFFFVADIFFISSWVSSWPISWRHPGCGLAWLRSDEATILASSWLKLPRSSQKYATNYDSFCISSWVSSCPIILASSWRLPHMIAGGTIILASSCRWPVGGRRLADGRPKKMFPKAGNGVRRHGSEPILRAVGRRTIGGLSAARGRSAVGGRSTETKMVFCGKI